MQGFGGFFVVLSAYNCVKLFCRSWALFLAGQSVARRYQSFARLKMSRFVEFVNDTGTGETRISVLMAVKKVSAWEFTALGKKRFTK